MKHENARPVSGKIGAIRRKSISISQNDLVTMEALQPESQLPQVLRPTVEGVDLLAWIQGHREFIGTQLQHYGGLLLRGFKVENIEHFQMIMKAACGELLAYRERSSPRSQVHGNIYTSTDHPADQSIFLHNENSYARTWPLQIAFCCFQAAQQGGETPIADSRKVFQRISPSIRERFMAKHVMYVRNYGDGFGLPWQTVFQTEDPAVVEAYCSNVDIQVEWKEDGRLRTRKIGHAVVHHPRTGELSWFNHATFFHVSTLEDRLEKALLSEFGPEDLPTNTFYGDGSPIEPEVLEELRACYMQETVAFPWQERDILLLDNMITAHGRAPFVGEREVVVAMAEPTSEADVTWETRPSLERMGSWNHA